MDIRLLIERIIVGTIAGIGAFVMLAIFLSLLRFLWPVIFVALAIAGVYFLMKHVCQIDILK